MSELGTPTTQETAATNPPAASSAPPQAQQAQSAAAATNWLDSIPEVYRGDHNVTKYASMDDFVKSHLGLVSKVGVPSVPVPQDGWTPEQWSEFYQKLGRPESAEKYDIQRPEVPDGVQYDEALEKWFRETAHKSGITQKQAKALFEDYTKFSLERVSAQGAEAQQQQESRAAEIKKGIDTIKQEHGDKYPAMIDAAQKAVKQFGGEELANHLNETGLGNDPQLIRFFIKLGSTLMEDTFRSGSTFRAGNVNKSAGEALAEIGTLKSDKNFQATLMNKSANGHSEAVKRWQALHDAAYPEAEKE